MLTTSNSALSLGLPLSYLPQCHRIISRGSSYGLSPSFIAISTAYSSSAFANALLLASADGAVDCCQYNGFHGKNCFAALTSIWQHGLFWLGSTVV